MRLFRDLSLMIFSVTVAIFLGEQTKDYLGFCHHLFAGAVAYYVSLFLENQFFLKDMRTALISTKPKGEQDV